MVYEWEIEDNKDIEAQNGQEGHIAVFQKEINLCYV